MENNTYNGRANRSTWLVSLRYSPKTTDDVEYAKQDIEEKYDSLNGFFKDMIDLQDIDWDEIEEAIEE